ncbi:hypothetical protein AAMO2058_000622800 [Amorphochlora amoebiformis]
MLESANRLFQKVDWEIFRWSGYCAAFLMVEAIAMPLCIAAYKMENASPEASAGYFLAFWLSLLQFTVFLWRLTYDIFLRRVNPKVIERVLSSPRLIADLILVGFFMTLEILFYSYSASTTRVPGAIQPILLQTIVLWNVLLSKVILGMQFPKGQLFGLFLIVAGIITCMGATIADASGEKLPSGPHWLVIFTFGCFFSACSNIVTEQVFEQIPLLPVNFILTMASSFQLLSIGFLFWIDLVPGLGGSRSLDEFGSAFIRGIDCTFSPSTSRCSLAVPLSTLYVGSHVMLYVFGFRLVRVASGNYFSTLQVLANCISLFFWFAFPKVNKWAGGVDYDWLDVLCGSLSVPPIILGIYLFRRFEEPADRHVILNDKKFGRRSLFLPDDSEASLHQPIPSSSEIDILDSTSGGTNI